MMAAISVWQQERNYKLTKAEYDRVYKESQESPEILAEAEILAKLLPPKTLDLLHQRVDACWEEFDESINSEADRDSADDAEINLEDCVCSELRRIKRLNGDVPKGKLRDWWNHYGCGPLIR